MPANISDSVLLYLSFPEYSSQVLTSAKNLMKISTKSIPLFKNLMY